MTTYTTEFSFDSSNNNAEIEFIGNDGETLFLRLQRYSHSVAVLYFMNEDKQRINIPTGIEVMDVTNDVKNIGQFCKSETFCLAWTDDYYVTYFGRIIFTTASKRILKLHSAFPFIS